MRPTNFRRGIAPLIILFLIAAGVIGGGAVIHTVAKGPPTPEQVTALTAIGAASDPYTLGFGSLAMAAIVAAWKQYGNANAATTALGEYHAGTPTAGDSPVVSADSFALAVKAANGVRKRNAKNSASNNTTAA